MTLLDAVKAELPAMRERAESLMVDTCTIAAPGSETFDPDTGEYVTTPGASLYSGPCQVQVAGPSVGEAVVGEQQVALERIIVKIPVGSAATPPDSVVTITAVSDLSDPALVGRVFRVTGTHAKTFATARRLPCELVTP